MQKIKNVEKGKLDVKLLFHLNNATIAIFSQSIIFNGMEMRCIMRSAKSEKEISKLMIFTSTIPKNGNNETMKIFFNQSFEMRKKLRDTGFIFKRICLYILCKVINENNKVGVGIN